MKKNLLFLLLVFAYHFLFWKQALGLNLAAFSLVLGALSYTHHGIQNFTRSEGLLAFSLLVSAGAVVLVNSVISIVVLMLSTISYLGYLAQRQSSVLEGFANSLLSLFRFNHPIFPEKFFSPGKKRSAGALYLRIAIVPLIIFVLYFALFSAGNPIFKEWGHSLFGRFFQYLENISWDYVIFLIFGVMLARWAFMTQRRQSIQLEPGSQLARKSKKATRFTKKMGLRYEYLTALMIFVSLNLLFVVVNFIDVKWVWFQFSVPANFSLKSFVHEGVGWLILTLLLSMLLIFYFFRYNLNFYPNNRFLKILAQLWIFQNAVLAVSVAVRTFHYINFHGLASKRVGVLIFLLMVIFGLASLSYKILLQKNTAFVLKVNSAFALVLFTLCSIVPWDSYMARYNLSHHMPHEVDVDNYLDLNPQAYPIIYENLQSVEDQIAAHNRNEVRWISFTDIDSFKERLDLRAKQYLERREGYTSASWSLPDSRATASLQKILNGTETAAAF